MTDLSPEAKSLFGAARRELGPSSEDRGRLARRLSARLGAAALTTSTLAAAGSTSGAAVGVKLALPLLVKWLGVGLLLGGGLTSGYLLLRAPSGAGAARGAPAAAPSTSVPVARARAEAAPIPSALEPTRAPEASPNTEASIEPRALDARQARAGNGARAAAAEPSDAAAPSARVGEETALMRRAHAALRAGDANRALSLLRDHAVRFPGGILAEERSAELVSTLCQLGRRAEAEREARRFLRELASSPLAPSVRASCAFPSSSTKAR
jgi:hypothetical protein